MRFSTLLDSLLSVIRFHPQIFTSFSHHGKIAAKWNLRFVDPKLEQKYIEQLVERDGTMTRWFMTITLIAAIGLNLSELHTLDPAISTASVIVRVPLFFVCWLVWIIASHQRLLFPFMPWIAMVCLSVGTLILSSSQWFAWMHGVDRPYQTLLLIVMIAPMLGCMPWRIGSWVGLFSAITLAAPEIVFQSNEGLRNMHLAYIALALFSGLFTGYAYERNARQHFLISDSFLSKSRFDPLTALPNRREMSRLLPRLMRQAARERVRLVVAMIDVDHFKLYNDYYGHPAGDTALKRVARALSRKAKLRPTFVARYGGEEFVAVWFNPSAEPNELGESIRTAVEAENIEHSRSERQHITISVGIGYQYPTSRSDMERILRYADEALYRAKESGRNCVRCEEVPALRKDHNQPHTGDWYAHQRRSDTAYAAGSLPAVTRIDYKRWCDLRGFHEREQLQAMALRAIFIYVTIVFISFFSLPFEAIWRMGAVILFAIIPYMGFGLYLTRFDWPVRHVRYLLPLFLLPTGLALCWVFWHTLQIGYNIPYEVLLLLIFQCYFVGSYTWRIAALCCWAFTFAYLGVLYAVHSPNLPAAAVPFVVLNIIGMVGSRAQDLRSLDSFLKAERLKSLAWHDELTGLSNRSGLENYYRNMLPLLATSEYRLAVAMVDIDYFKKFNDHYGHAAGDQVLAAIGQVLEHCCQRAYDIAVRYGGEEFALVWYQASEEKFPNLGDRVCNMIASQCIQHEKNEHGRVTVSVGMAYGVLSSKQGMSAFDALLRQADHALYRAKRSGRNCVAVYQQEDAAPPDVQ